jgi:hypothetical protein
MLRGFFRTGFHLGPLAEKTALLPELFNAELVVAARTVEEEDHASNVPSNTTS